MKTIYYWIYKILQKTRKEEDPAFGALCSMTFINCWHVFVIIRIFSGGKSIVLSKDMVVLLGVCLFLIVLVINYYLVYKTRKVFFIQMENSTSAYIKKSKLFFYSYLCISIVLIYGILFFY